MGNGLQGYDRCNGCGLCNLSCPLWQQNRDVALTFSGRISALQGGVDPHDLKASLEACLLCGSCEPVCSIGIPTVDFTLKLRAALNGGGPFSSEHAQTTRATSGRSLLMPGRALREHEALLHATETLLGLPVCDDDGIDILAAFERGQMPAAERSSAFRQALSGVRHLVVADGLMKRYVRAHLPGIDIIGLGEALLRLPRVQAALRPTDLYIIEARSYNADYERCAPLYTDISRQRGCAMNLDLQRIAIPTGVNGITNNTTNAVTDRAGQIDWILAGRTFERIVVEDAADIDPLHNATGVPVVHVAALPEDTRQ